MSVHEDARRLLDDVERYLRQEESLNGPLLLDGRGVRSAEAAVSPKRPAAPATGEPELFNAGAPSLPAYPAEPWVATATIEELRAAICECQKCSLGATRKKFVFGVGNPNADIVL
ncbi:MAG: hypothetical protein AABY75_00455, partial [Bacteroidota bacterium]